MTENERVKEIRKANKLSMEKFGESLGVSGAAISMIESGERNVSTQIEMLICSKYDINETWLRTGEGEMKAEQPEDEIDAVIKKYDLSEEVRVMLEQFVKLRSDHQEIIADYIESVAASLRGDTPAASHSGSALILKPVHANKTRRNALSFPLMTL